VPSDHPGDHPKVRITQPAGRVYPTFRAVNDPFIFGKLFIHESIT
jgi:hypothetical protein